MPKVFETLGLDADDLAVLENRLPSPLAHLVFRLISADDATKAYDAVVDLFKESSRLLLVIAWALAAQREVALPAGVAADIRERWVRGKRRDLTERQRSEAFDRIVDAVLAHVPKDAAARALREAFPPFHEDAGRRALSAARTDDGHGTTPPDAEVMAELHQLGPAVVGFLGQWKRLTGREGGALVLGIAEGRTSTDLVGNPRRGTSELPSPCEGPVVRIAGDVIRLAPLVRSAGAGGDLHLYVAQGRDDSRTGRLVQVWPTGKGELGDADLFTWVQAQCREVTRVVGEPKAHKLLAQHFRAWGKSERSRPLVVIGSAGTGKSLLIQDALRHEVPKAQVLRISGELVGRDVERLVVEVLGRLSGGEDLAWDGRVASWLEREAERLGHMRGKRLATWLRQGIGTGVRPTAVGASESTSQGTAPTVPTGSVDPVEVLWDFLVAFGDDAGAKLAVWIEDAQSCGLSPSVVDQLANQGGFRPNGPLLVAEYRTLGTDDAKETRKRHKRQCEVVECVELDERGTQELSASLLGVSPTDARKVSQWLYRQTSGNPKFVRELVRWLQDRGALIVPAATSRDEGPGGPILFLPPDRAAVPEGLKAMARARIDAATRSASARDLVLFVAAAGHSWIEVGLLQRIFGDEVRDEVTRLVDKIGLLRESDEHTDRPWAVRLEHLVAQESALELLDDIDDQDAEALAARCAAALERVATASDHPRGNEVLLSALVRLATRAGDGDALAVALTRMPARIHGATPDQLEAWLRLLRRTTSPRGKVARDYVLALRGLAESTKVDDDVARHLAASVEGGLELCSTADGVDQVLYSVLPLSAAARLVRAESPRAPAGLRQIADWLDRVMADSAGTKGEKSSLAAAFAFLFDAILSSQTTDPSQLQPVRSALPADPLIALALLVEIDDSVLKDVSDIRSWAGPQLEALEAERTIGRTALVSAVGDAAEKDGQFVIDSMSRLGSALLRAAYSGETTPEEIRAAWRFVSEYLTDMVTLAREVPSLAEHARAVLAERALEHAGTLLRRGMPEDSLSALTLVPESTKKHAYVVRLLSLRSGYLLGDDVVSELAGVLDDLDTESEMVDIDLLALAVETVSTCEDAPASSVERLLRRHFAHTATSETLDGSARLLVEASQTEVDLEPYFEVLRRVASTARERLEVDFASWQVRTNRCREVDTARRLFGEVNSLLESREAELATPAMRDLRNRLVGLLSQILNNLPAEHREDRPARVLRRLDELDHLSAEQRPAWWWQERWQNLVYAGRADRVRKEVQEQLDRGNGTLPRWRLLDIVVTACMPPESRLFGAGPPPEELAIAWEFGSGGLLAHSGGSTKRSITVAWLGALRGSPYREEGQALLERAITTSRAIGNPRAVADLIQNKVLLLAVCGELGRAHETARELRDWLVETPGGARRAGVLLLEAEHDLSFLEMALRPDDPTALRRAMESFRTRASAKDSPRHAQFNALVAEILLDGPHERVLTEIRSLMSPDRTPSEDSMLLMAVPTLEKEFARLDVVGDLSLREAAAAVVLRQARRTGNVQQEAEARAVFARPTTRRHDVGPMPYARFVSERLGLPLPPMK